MSHVGWRLMVASSANTSLPRLPAACGDIALALATKAAMSSEAEGFCSDNEPALRPSGAPGFGSIGSPDMDARLWMQAYVGGEPTLVNPPTTLKPFA
jgi:hypothetical protein